MSSDMHVPSSRGFAGGRALVAVLVVVPLLMFTSYLAVGQSTAEATDDSVPDAAAERTTKPFPPGTPRRGNTSTPEWKDPGLQDSRPYFPHDPSRSLKTEVIQRRIPKRDAEGRLRYETVYETREAGIGPPLQPPVPGFPPGAAYAQRSDDQKRITELAQRVLQAEDEPKRESLRKELESEVEELFVKQRQRQLEALDQLEKQLQSLRELDEKRQDRKGEIVQRRVRELLGESDVLDFEIQIPRVVTTDSVQIGVEPEASAFADQLPAFEKRQRPSRPSRPAPPKRPASLDSPSPPLTPQAPKPGEATPDADVTVPQAMQLRAKQIELALVRRQRDAVEDAETNLGLNDAERILDLREQVRQAEAQRREARALGNAPSAERLKAAVEAARARLALAELRWNSQKTMVRSEMEQRETQLTVASKQLDRIKELGPSSELLEAEAKVAIAKSKLAASHRSMEALEKAEAIIKKASKEEPVGTAVVEDEVIDVEDEIIDVEDETTDLQNEAAERP